MNGGTAPNVAPNRQGVAAALMLGTVGAGMLLALPGMASALNAQYGFSNAEVGFLASAELAGLTLGSAIGALLISRFGLVKTTRVAVLSAVLLNLIAATTVHYVPLLVFRAFSEIGAGVAVSACYVALGRSRNVDRNFSYYMMCQLLFGAIALYAIPIVTERVGIAGLYVSFGALLLCAFACTGSLAAFAENHVALAVRAKAQPAAWFGLLATLVYFIGQGAMWAYMSLLGERAGLSPPAVASGMAIALVAGLAGPVMSAALSNRLGRAIPILVGLCATLIALAALSAPLTFIGFVAAVTLFNGSWNFTVPYQLAAIARIEPTGRVIGWTASVSLAGLAIGPLLGALLVGDGGLRAILWLCAGFSALGALAFTPLWITKAAERQSP
jgi:MFS family permease